jgi:multiple antibiotic resistance protein
MSDGERTRILTNASVFALFLLLLFLFGSNAIFHYLDICLEHIMIAGGILLVLLGFEMMFGGDAQSTYGQDVAIVPLGMPLMAGGGSIATTLVISAAYGIATSLLALAIVMIIQFGVYTLAPRILLLLGKNGLKVMGNVAALVAASFGIEILLKGVLGII